jgi:hypothetical protein
VKVSAGSARILMDVAGYYSVTPPGPVTAVIATPTTTSIALSWTDPADASFTSVMIRRAQGATPPATATAGTLVVDAAKPATSYTNTGLASGTQYSYALFAHDGTPGYAAAATVTSTTLTPGKTAWTWGFNGQGQLGDGTTTDRSTPEQVGTDTGWASVVAGDLHTVAVKTDGTLWAWGLNNYGQLGYLTPIDPDTGFMRYQPAPAQVGTDTHWATVSAGVYHTVAVKTDGTLWTWGDNADGELGDGTGINRSSPVQVGADTHWAFVAANWHTLAVKTDGTLWAWGPNWFGELGDGTGINRSAPVQVGTDTGWATVSAGNLGTVAVKTDGTLWAWGEEFGVDPFTYQLAPVQVGTDTHWAFVTAGRNHAVALRW